MTAFERRILDALPFMVCSVDLDGRITGTNRSPAPRAGAERDVPPTDDIDDRGVAIWDAIADHATRTQVEQAMESLRSGHMDEIRWESPASTPGDARLFAVHMVPLRQRRTTTGFVFAIVDLTPSHRWREALLDSGIALSRMPDAARAWHEVARQARRATACDGIAIGMVVEETGQVTLAFQSGFDERDDALESRLAPLWSTALASGHVVTTAEADRTTVVAPMFGATGAIGTITLCGAQPDHPYAREATERTLLTLAAQAAAALERGQTARRAEHQRRIDTIGEVAAGVAQELRNPLFGISSAAQLLRFRTGEDPVVEKNVGRILRDVERLNRMVASLLEYGRPAPLAVAPHDPDAVWDSVLDTLRGRLESKALIIDRTRLTPSAICAVDPEQLTQLFSHLLINASDAAPNGGTVGLTTDLTPGGAWRARLHNGGSVISPDVLPRVFELFFSTKPGGTGIGLALCQRIVAGHNGTIGIDSAAERGTTVTVTIPTSG